MGAEIEKPETGKIKIMGVSIFKNTTFEVCSDKSEIAMFATLAVLTRGNISIKNIGDTAAANPFPTNRLPANIADTSVTPPKIPLPLLQRLS